jgi:GAF domain-containing protein
MPDLLKRILTPPVFEGDEDKTRIARMLNVILWVALAIVLSSLFSVLVTPYTRETLLAVGSFALPILSSLVLMRRGWVQLAGGLFSFSLLVFATALPILSGGVHSAMVTEFLVAVCVAGLLLRGRTPFILVGLVIAISGGVALAEMNGLLPPPFFNLTNPLLAIMPLVANTPMVAALLYLATSSLSEALGRARRYGAELKAQSDRLEELVQARTQDLARRTNYLGATTAVAQESASELSDPQQLLSRVVDVISKQFGFYHAGLFLMNPAGEWAELSAASSEGGRLMLARGHRLRVGVGDAGQGIVGHVAARGESRIALDTGADAVFFDNPDLPETRSEAALPLQVRGEIIGVLDVQSTQPGAFSEEDVRILQALADQVAVAISNARLFQQAQGSLEVERRAYGEVGREAWGALLHARPDLGFYRDERGVFPIGDVEQPEEAQRTRKTPGADDATKQTMPIKVRGHTIGVIDAHKPAGAGEWTAEEAALMETLADQLGVALESTRLYQDSQHRAATEQLIGEVTARMRESLDMDRVLQTAVREIGQALGIAEVEVRMSSKVTTGS